MHDTNAGFRFAVLLGALFGLVPLTTPAQMQRQQASPMSEHIRAHQRLPDSSFAGRIFRIAGPLPRAIELYLPPLAPRQQLPLLLHFHGPLFIVQHATNSLSRPIAGAAIQFGAGSAAYERPFLTPAQFPVLLQAITDSLATMELAVTDVILSSFSAGYGAVRAILQQEANVARLYGVLLLDGLHTDYVPESTPLASGGRLNEAKLAPFLYFARLAIQSEKRMIITHSEIFPGTYASTTETAAYLLQELDLPANPVLQWGPLGMQQLAHASHGTLAILAFAGNSAPDHIDHLHALPHFLSLLLDLRAE